MLRYNVLLVFMLYFVQISFTQNVTDKQVERLIFPYMPGYFLSFKCNKTIYDNYNFPKKIEHFSMKYSFFNFEKDVMKCPLKFITDTGSTTMNTFLQMNAAGLQYWFKDDSLKMKDKHKTVAIDLPLYKGKKWITYLGDQKAELTCVSTDTVIDTKFGKLNTFYIEGLMLKTKNKIVYKTHEFYNQNIGKVYSYYTYSYFDEKSQTVYIIRKDEFFIDDFKK